MCDQDHFEDDRREFDPRGQVTRKQLGVMLGAGVAMMLPRVANAVTAKEEEVETIRGTAPRTAISSTWRAAPAKPYWCGRTSSDCVRLWALPAFAVFLAI